MRNTRYNTFAIVIPGFSDSESDIGNDIPSISSDILGISNRKNRYTRFIENMFHISDITQRYFLQHLTKNAAVTAETKNTAPIEEYRLMECMLYKDKVSPENNFKLYFGTFEGKFKCRFYNHTKLFRGTANETKFPKYIWQLMDQSENYNIRWKIFMYATPCNCGTRCCNLCRTGKYVIVRAYQKHLVNKRTEIIS